MLYSEPPPCPPLLHARPSAAPRWCPSSHRHVHCHIPTGLCPHFTDEGDKAYRAIAPARSQNPLVGPWPASNPLTLRASPFLTGPHGLHALRWHPASASMPANTIPMGRGPHSSLCQGQVLQGHRDAPSAWPSPDLNCPLLPTLLLPLWELNHSQPCTSSRPCRPGAWRSSWLPPPSHPHPQASALLLSSYLLPPPPRFCLSLPSPCLSTGLTFISSILPGAPDAAPSPQHSVYPTSESSA